MFTVSVERLLTEAERESERAKQGNEEREEEEEEPRKKTKNSRSPHRSPGRGRFGRGLDLGPRQGGAPARLDRRERGLLGLFWFWRGRGSCRREEKSGGWFWRDCSPSRDRWHCLFLFRLFFCFSLATPIHRTVLTLLLASTSLPSSSEKAASSRASGGPVASILRFFFLLRRVSLSFPCRRKRRILFEVFSHFFFSPSRS